MTGALFREHPAERVLTPQALEMSKRGTGLVGDFLNLGVVSLSPTLDAEIT